MAAAADVRNETGDARIRPVAELARCGRHELARLRRNLRMLAQRIRNSGRREPGPFGDVLERDNLTLGFRWVNDFTDVAVAKQSANPRLNCD